MRRRKEVEKSGPAPSPNEQINASVLQEMREGEEDREAIGTPKAQAKTLTQKQLPHAMNRTLFLT